MDSTDPSPLRSARLRLGLTLQQAAAKVGTSHPTFSAVEQGKRPASLDLLHSWAMALGIDPHELDPRLKSVKRARRRA